MTDFITQQRAACFRHFLVYRPSVIRASVTHRLKIDTFQGFISSLLKRHHEVLCQSPFPLFRTVTTLPSSDYTDDLYVQIPALYVKSGVSVQSSQKRHGYFHDHGSSSLASQPARLFLCIRSRSLCDIIRASRHHIKGFQHVGGRT